MVGEPAGWRVIVEVDRDDLELVSDRLFACGALGIEERAAIDDRVLLLAGMPDETSAAAAAGAFSGARVEPVADDGWADEWRAWARPVRVGDVVVQPAWLPLDDLTAHCTAVIIDPGRAFGSGAHDTTRLALAALLDLDIDHASRVLDVGCGSGVLGVAVALVRGARVTAIDVDPAAVDTTARNAEHNGVAELVRAATTPLCDFDGACDGAYDVVVANILAVTLRESAADFARVLAADGTLVLSGMLRDQLAGVDAACAAAGLVACERRESGDWCARRYVRSAPR
jgi:ribosomal protein L11 methyltransferase